MSVPGRAEVERLMVQLVAGEVAREDAADWAARRMEDEDASPSDLWDPVVWDALTTLRGADLLAEVDEYLYDEADLRDWLERFRSA